MHAYLRVLSQIEIIFKLVMTYITRKKFQVELFESDIKLGMLDERSETFFSWKSSCPGRTKLSSQVGHYIFNTLVHCLYAPFLSHWKNSYLLHYNREYKSFPHK